VVGLAAPRSTGPFLGPRSQKSKAPTGGRTEEPSSAERIRSRRGRGIATVAVARKLVGAVLASAHEGGGLRLRAAIADQEEVAPPRAARRRRAPPLGRAPQDRRHLAQDAAGRRHRARPPSRGRLPAAGHRLAADTEEGRGRDTGTRIFRPSKRQAARQGVGPRPCALARRQDRRPARTLANRRSCVQGRLDFHASSKTGVCDCRPFASAIGPIAGVGRQAALSVERDDDLAVGAALLDVRQRLEGLVERERLVDERAEVAGVVEGGQLAQLPAVGLHEQKRVAHA
jgi:hypothetical protein